MRSLQSSFTIRADDPCGPLETEGYVCKSVGSKLELSKVVLPSLGFTMVEVKIMMVGLCHTDVHMRDNDWGISDYPLLTGHEAVGTVVRTGEGVQSVKLGDRVGISWIRDSCGQCTKCKIGRENICWEGYQGTYLGKSAGKWGKNELNYNEHGGCFARVQRVEEKMVVRIPEGVPDEMACPLLCGGGTVYEPLREYGGVNVRVGIAGMGGLGVSAVKLARLMGCVVVALSGSKGKREKVLGIGAHEFVDMGCEEEVEKVRGGLDLIIDTTPGGGGKLGLLRADGRYVRVGIPEKKKNELREDWYDLIFEQKRVEGSAITGSARLREMFEAVERNLEFMEQGDWKVEVVGMEKINECMDLLKAGLNKGFRYVLKW